MLMNYYILLNPFTLAPRPMIIAPTIIQADRVTLEMFGSPGE